MRRVMIGVFLFLPVFLQAQHDPQVVRDKLKIVLAELDSPENTTNWDITPFWKNLIRFLSSGRAVFRFLFFAAVGAIVFFVLYKLIGFFIRDRVVDYSLGGLPPPEKKGDRGTSENPFRAEAAAAAEAGDYSRAIVTLHRGSVESLYSIGVLSRTREYTNGEIAGLLGAGDRAEAFFPLARKAELIVFADRVGEKEEYLRFDNDYGRYFS